MLRLARFVLRFTWIVSVILMFSFSRAWSDDVSDPGQYLKLNGLNIYYEIHGSGEPLLLLHGGLSHGNAWHEQVAAFAPHYKLILMDSRGHGRSELGTEQISYTKMTDDVLALLDLLHIERTHLLGWSDGAIIGLHMAIRAPQRLGKLIAFGANYQPSGVREEIGENKRFSKFFTDSANDYQTLSPSPDQWQSFLDNIMKMWASEPDFSTAQLAGITAEVLVLAGATEEAIKIPHLESMAKLIPNSTLALMPGTGHFALWEKPAEFNRIVLAFLK